jgi:thymidylate kinase
MEKGLFIVLDGNDGSGKATQTARLSQFLEQKGISSEKIDFPAYDRNFFGGFVGECLAGKHGDFLHMDPKIASTLSIALKARPSYVKRLMRGRSSLLTGMQVQTRFTKEARLMI